MDSRPTILVVEDNKTEQKLIALLLDRFGYNAVIAPDGHAAVRHLEDGSVFSLILMDWQMGFDMDGLECTRRIRALQERHGRSTPIVAVTARAMLGDKQKCLAAGMDDYLSKPFTTAQFQSMLERWVSQCQSRTG